MMVLLFLNYCGPMFMINILYFIGCSTYCCSVRIFENILLHFKSFLWKYEGYTSWLEGPGSREMVRGTMYSITRISLCRVSCIRTEKPVSGHISTLMNS